MNTQTRIVNSLTGTVALMVLLIGAGAFVLSYDALYATGAAYGVPSAKAWIWPLLIDAPLIVFTLALLVSQIMRSSAKLWAALVGVYTLATIGFNLSHAQPSPLGWTVAIVAPVGLLLTTEALRHLAKNIIERQAVVSTLAELAAQRDILTADLDKLNGQVKDKRAELNTLQEAISVTNAHLSLTDDHLSKANEAKLSKVAERRQEVLSLVNEGLSPDDIAGQMGVSLRTIKRDITALNGQVRVTA